jgi:tetratricopeptide (TPR) repeat protein
LYLAQAVHNRGRYSEAEPLFRRVIAVYRDTLGEDHPNTVKACNNLAENLWSQGRYAEAESLRSQAMAIYRRTKHPNRADVARLEYDLARVVAAQGNSRAAGELLGHALDTFRRELPAHHPDIAGCEIVLAAHFRASGRIAEAEGLSREALTDLEHSSGDPHRMAFACRILASCVASRGLLVNAEKLFRKAVAICSETYGNDHPDTVEALTDLASNLRRQRKLDEAIAIASEAARGYEKARVRISVQGLERADFAVGHSPGALLAALLAAGGNPRAAWRALENDLARALLDEVVARRGHSRDASEERREDELLARLQRIDKELGSLGSATGRPDQRNERRSKLRLERDRVQTELSAIQDEMTKKHGVPAGEVFDLARIQLALEPDSALLAWLDLSELPGRAGSADDHWCCLVRKAGDPTWIKLAGSGAGGAWTTEDQRLPNIVRGVLSQRPNGAASSWQAPAVRLAAQRLGPLAPYLVAGPAGPVIRSLIVLPSPALAGLPTEALVEAGPSQWGRPTVSYAPSGTLCAWLAERRRTTRREPAETSRLLALGDPVYEPREREAPSVADLPEHGAMIVRVVPASNAERGGIHPGDVVTRYAGREVTRASDLKPTTPKEASVGVPVEVWREGKTLTLTVREGPLGIALDERPVPEAVRDRRDTDRLIAGTRSDALTPLPGTRKEVEAIARLFDRPTVLFASAASEQSLDGMARSSDLPKFDFIHIAAHGKMDAEVAMRSRIYLARDALPDPLTQVLEDKPFYDGELTAEQIRRTWKLDANLVTLSACETALGKPSGGEGYLGFSQALLLSGAHSLLLSQWRVDDRATALLMTRFYQNLLGKRPELTKPMRKAEALREAKMWLRGLSGDQAELAMQGIERGPVRRLPAGARQSAAFQGEKKGIYDHPYYWAAFVLIGDPD